MTIAGVRAQRRPVTSPQPTAPSATATSRKKPASPSAAAGRQVGLADAHREHDREHRARERLQPDQHPGQAHGRRRRRDAGRRHGAVVAGHGARG